MLFSFSHSADAFRPEHGAKGLEWSLEKLCHQASSAVADGYDIFILSDRQMNEYGIPIPALLAVSAVHHHLTRKGTRTQVGLVLESGAPREVHHFALLLGYGAGKHDNCLARTNFSGRLWTEKSVTDFRRRYAPIRDFDEKICRL